MKRFLPVLLALAVMAGAALFWVRRAVDPPVETIVASSLKSLHEQNRLSAFAARFVTVVTSRKDQFGLSAQKTLILPAMVRYEVDLAKLKQADLDWDAATKTLSVSLPPVEISGPEFDLTATQEYESGAVLMALTDVERLLDAENRKKAEIDVLRQAKAMPTLRMAQDATIRAVSASFAMPLAAAGIDAKVKVEMKQ
ncbi:MAG TPA: DUF4230 domain-containing protein [Chakrabartia sp.]|jgi:hypothetical protein|nr:DUF4230 domain-containing protein [Chakrabartia sp.]